MRTVIAITIGLVLAFGFVFASNLLGKSKITGAILFLCLWLIFCGVDYSNGVKAGYSAVDELGIHILVFALPAIGAWLTARFLP
jgi:cell shape-determining protein MreD